MLGFGLYALLNVCWLNSHLDCACVVLRVCIASSVCVCACVRMLVCVHILACVCVCMCVCACVCVCVSAHHSEMVVSEVKGLCMPAQTCHCVALFLNPACVCLCVCVYAQMYLTLLFMLEDTLLQEEGAT